MGELREQRENKRRNTNKDKRKTNERQKKDKRKATLILFMGITTVSYCAAWPRRESVCVPPLPRGGGGPISVKIGPPPPRGRGGTHTHFRDAATLGSSGRGRHTYRSNPPDRQRGEPLTEASSSGAQRHNTVQPHKRVSRPGGPRHGVAARSRWFSSQSHVQCAYLC